MLKHLRVQTQQKQLLDVAIMHSIWKAVMHSTLVD